VLVTLRSSLLAQYKASLTLQETSTYSQGNDLSDANDANHNQIKLDDQSSSMNMLREILGYAINKQSQMYLEIKACESIRTR
jgi:hypothetical protein